MDLTTLKQRLTFQETKGTQDAWGTITPKKKETERVSKGQYKERKKEKKKKTYHKSKITPK
jgi:hypothetical protein